MTGKGRKRQRVRSLGGINKIPLLHKGDFETGAGVAKHKKRVPAQKGQYAVPFGLEKACANQSTAAAAAATAAAGSRSPHYPGLPA
eukprot:152610-Pelagomonas_calceolata.AAC.1